MRSGSRQTVRDQAIDAQGLTEFLRQLKLDWQETDIAFVCIGTDRSTGDAFGPLIGSLLEEQGYLNVVGTLQSPCDSNNLEARMKDLLQGTQPLRMIAIDACLGQEQAVGRYFASKKPIEPGKALGKLLPPVGDASIKGIVNRWGPKVYTSLLHASLYTVMDMANQVVRCIEEVFPVEQ